MVDTCMFDGRMEGCHVAQPEAAMWNPIFVCLVKVFWSPWGRTRDLRQGIILCKGQAASLPTLVLNHYGIKLLFKVALKSSLGGKGSGLSPSS
jgi:hypothetical protein